jgi:hypothetical protein
MHEKSKKHEDFEFLSAIYLGETFLHFLSQIH